MNSLKNIKFLGLLLLITLLFEACGTEPPTNTTISTDNKVESSKKTGDASVTIWEMSDPEGLNPLTAMSENARYIQLNIFSRLLEYNPKTIELEPQTAIARPIIKEIETGEYAGGMSLTFEINPDAKWDNGEAVTAEDYIFTIKAIKNPLVNAGGFRVYYEFIDDIAIDPENPKKFTIYSKERYFIAEEATGDLPILPRYIYDSEGLMRKFSVKYLSTSNFSTLSKDPDLIRFANQFNAPKFNREQVVGSGPYKFSGWESGQYITLELKKDWWGSKSDNPLLKAHPPKITYKIINDQKTAVTAAKDEQLDVIRNVKPQRFIELKEDDKFQENFEISTPNRFAYYYIGINNKDPKFQDKRVRRALAYLVDRDEVIEVLFANLAVKTNGPINPYKPHYHPELKGIEQDLEKAKALLEEAGWTDSDNNGILDKVIGGQKVEMKVKYKFNIGNDIRKNIGGLLAEQAKKVGIQIELVSLEWAVFLEQIAERDFELMSLGWIQGPGLDDLKQIWHSESDTRTGNNRVGFNNREVDELIDKIRVTLDEDKRTEMYKRVQEIIHEEQPYIFLCVPSERIIIHNRFQNIETSALRPGYKESRFQLKASDAQ